MNSKLYFVQDTGLLKAVHKASWAKSLKCQSIQAEVFGVIAVSKESAYSILVHDEHNNYVKQLCYEPNFPNICIVASQNFWQRIFLQKHQPYYKTTSMVFHTGGIDGLSYFLKCSNKKSSLERATSFCRLKKHLSNISTSENKDASINQNAPCFIEK